MDAARLRALLEGVKAGDVRVDDALASLKTLPYEDLGFAKVDHHRSLRNGFPEVIYCPGKTTPHIIDIVGRIIANSRKVLASRAEPAVADAVREVYPHAVYHPMARMIVVSGVGEDPPVLETSSGGTVLIVSAGTADLPVAEEAAVTAHEMGSNVRRLYDVGVAGIHRLLTNQNQLFDANVIVVAAGMEGALASVVGGLVARPVIAVPTSVGYGANFHGLSALLTMLNSCATGIGVVNIDNGFGAGFLAHLINQNPHLPPIAADGEVAPI